MFCWKCGQPNSDDAAFCSQCGAPQKPSSQPTTKPVRYAGFWLRFVAHMIDQIVLSAVMLVFYGFAILANIGVIADLAQADEPSLEHILAFIGPWIVVGFMAAIMQWLYYALMESSSHRATLGKLALSLAVTDMDGETISFARATGRYFGKIISGLILMIGYIMAGVTQKKQALHDLMAGTLVVRSQRTEYDS
ncbi:MAG: RDD family protein [Calditrichaeota bacterium]|nr:RDD family protein [Calditrichota bacterium]